MKNKFQKYISPAVLCGILGLTTFSCSQLEDVALDKVTNSSSVSPSAQLAAAYNQLGAFTDQANIYALTEHSTDEMQGPTRGTDWDDAGRWRNIHTQTWTGTSVDVVGAWDGLNKGHALANEAIFNAGNDKAILAEATYLRAFYMFYIMDLFGKVPFKENNGGTITASVLTRAQACDKIISELESTIPNLSNATKNANSGKATKQAAQALLAKVYLNRAVYTQDVNNAAGPFTFAAADMAKVITYTDAVISSGLYSLNADYFANFGNENTTESSELIFAIANSKGQSLNAGSSVRNRYYMTTHYNQNPSGWNGFTTLSDFYNGFEQGDVRVGGKVINAEKSGITHGWLVGQQYGIGGVALTDRQGTPLVFSKDCSLTNAIEKEGIRGIKYAPDFDDLDAPANDYVFLRYADILLMKAEALHRSGKSADGLTIVNQVRKARGLAALATLTDAALLAERGHEFWWEGWRRNDMIRFGTFLAPFVNKKETSPAYRVVYIIPSKEIEVNPALTQNVGY